MQEREQIQKPTVALIGCDGNAFSIIAACRRAARRAGWSSSRWDSVQSDMMSGDYDHLLQVALEHFNVR